MTNQIKKNQRMFTGVVVSNKADKTIVVAVNRSKIHPKYNKPVTTTRKYQVDDPNNQYAVGDKVDFVECRPLSRHKRWRVTQTTKKA